MDKLVGYGGKLILGGKFDVVRGYSGFKIKWCSVIGWFLMELLPDKSIIFTYFCRWFVWYSGLSGVIVIWMLLLVILFASKNVKKYWWFLYFEVDFWKTWWFKGVIFAYFIGCYRTWCRSRFFIDEKMWELRFDLILFGFLKIVVSCE